MHDFTHNRHVRYLQWAVLGTFFAAGCEEAKKTSVPPLRPVKYQVVQQSGGVRTHVFSGETSAGVESRLSFKVAGTIETIAVKVGDRVTKGQLIAELDKTDYQLQVQQARASLTSARAQRRNAEATYQRVERMYETESASRSDLDAARAGFQTARANVNAAGKQVELARQQLSYTRLVAPVDGSIAQVPVERNENTSPGQPVVVLTSGDRPKVTVLVADKYIREVQTGATVKVRFPDLPGREFAAVVSEVSPTSSGSGASVTALVSDGQNDVRPGMSADVEFTFGSRDDKLRYVVPPAAVGQDRDGEFVYLIQRKSPGLGVIKRTAITIDPEPTADGIEILEGIKAGDLVVTAGLTRITDGLDVKVAEKKNP
ncbi:MAG: efflux RND transporter periplasmic adaptor subunit [Proteobacteria bacterium]|nr:efflux RND transporter periplasmic adaptor subunit [Pseudomonadota bacterium]